MLRFKRYHLENHCYFVTTVTRNRRPYFARPEIARIAVKNLQFYRTRGDYLLHAYAVMPDHVHLLLTPRQGSISDVMRNLKSFISRQVRGALGIPGPIWQSSFHDRVVRSETHLVMAIEYVHANPVQAGLTPDALGFSFSSASAYESSERDQLIDAIAVSAPVRAWALTYD